MMDDKKIEDAAKQHSEESYISDYFQACYKDAFKAGAKWAINEFLKNLWHPASEEPIANTSPILFDGRDREGYQIVKTSFFRSSYWNKTVEYYGIVRWLYIDDLFTKEGGEQ